MSVKQVIVMRTVYQHADGKNFGLRFGKMISQGSHAALADLSNMIRTNVDEKGNVSFKLSLAQLEWYNTNFRKVVLKVDSEEELTLLYEKAKALGLSTEMIIDSGLTEFHGVCTKTCISIGPDFDEKIDQVTGDNGPLGRLKPM